MIFLIILIFCGCLLVKELWQTICKIYNHTHRKQLEEKAEKEAEKILNDPDTHIIEIGDARILTFMVDGYQDVIVLHDHRQSTEKEQKNNQNSNTFHEK